MTDLCIIVIGAPETADSTVHQCQFSGGRAAAIFHRHPLAV